ncbi:Kinesin (SMY1 subfamily) [Handroanthus impetiginosus]|uniref:Kinesin (SMY1 subfamily) n=1 Tax=Handroanthus impetiginosus TaxID=429701 RepID=A0A2G9IB55_9LAMI|nr:Kinesin (SMY1 subfamily) [Handroanthus impetiginosus]
MAKPNSGIHENGRFFGSISASVPFKSLLPKAKQKGTSTRRSKLRLDSENIAPLDPNIQIRDPPLSASVSFSKKSPSKAKFNPQKEELNASVVQEKVPETPDPPVKVVVRIRPAKGLGIGDTLVRKVSENSITAAGRKYTFDSVFDSDSTQGDVYQLVGAPLVKDALSGYNTSIVAYGQTGSGKTYTMWGPPTAIVEGPSVSGLQGVVPRIFQNLFSEIQKEQGNSSGKQINYQCRCSFLEVYDDKIGDLLDPTQRDLEIEDNTKNGFYVENLSEEYVTCYEDVTQILIKGLSNRKIGTTSINSKSSRSHIMFTFIIESWCKESSSKCFGSSKISRINLVDLAGFERNVLDDASKQHVKEGKYIKKSTSQLGHLVNILAEGSRSGKFEEVPYKSSRLTHLLRESFGGNAKLSIICAISPDNKSNSETVSTLRFGVRAKLMNNEPVVNEITEDDVNDLSDQIRQLKEELMRAKSSTCNSISSSNHGYFRGGNVRKSLNKLRVSLNRSLILPSIDNDPEENLCINEDDVKELRLHINKIRGSHEDNLKEDSENGESTLLYSAEGCETEFTCEHYISCSEESENEEINSTETQTEMPFPDNIASLDKPDKISETSIAIDPSSRNSLSINGCHQSTVLQDPVFSESPKIKSSQRKSLVFESNHLPVQEDAVQTSKNVDVMRQSHQPDNIKSSLRSSRIFAGPTESLAASLHRGLQIIDYQERNSAPARSSISFSFEHLALKPCLSGHKTNASVQTSVEEGSPSFQLSATFVCTKCQGRETNEADGILKTYMVRVDGSTSSNGLTTQLTKDMQKDLALAIQREKELDSICKDQAGQIDHLNKMLEQCKCAIDQTSSCHSSSNFSKMKNQLQPINGDENEKFQPPNTKTKLLTWNSDENHEPEFIKEKCEVKEVQAFNSIQKSFTVEDREALLREIEVLRNKLQFYTDPPTRRSSNKLRSSLLSQSIQLRKSCACAQGNNAEEFEKERQKWMEMESDWISLTDELRIEIEANRQLAEQVQMELTLEKKCTQELDDALKRSVVNHARMIEHYADLQEKYNDMLVKHRAIMEGIAEVKKAATKAGAKGRHGSRFAKALSAELSALRVERERERELLKKENRSLKIQLKDTAEAVHAAGELLVRLREAEDTASLAEGKNVEIQEENEKLKKQIEKLKRKHKMEMITMKQYLAESRLPQSALGPPLYREDSDITHHDSLPDDDQAWRAEFGAIYQEYY